MKRSEVEVGKVYAAKISGSLVPVRIERDRGTALGYGKCERHTGWDAVNLSTHRQIHIATAARLRGEYKFPRCGVCANCLTRLLEKSEWTDRYVAIVNTGTQDEAVELRKAWKARCEQLPCLKARVPA
jgi:hypothetical protein